MNSILCICIKIQAEAATTDIKTLEQLLKKFRKVVAERREEYYREMGEKKAHKLKMKRLQMLLEKWRIIIFTQKTSV